MRRVAVYTPIDDETLAPMLGIYEGLGPLVRFEGVAAGSINSTFRVETKERVLYLRINEGKPFDALVYEKNLLEHLAQHSDDLDGVTTPRIVKNSIGGWFFPIVPGKHAMLFEELIGRELGIFEVEPEHARQVGAFLARAHGALASFDEERANPFGVRVVQGWLAELATNGVLPDVVPRLTATVDEVARPLAEARARGVIHGDLFINNTKWRRGQLHAVFDWEMAGDDAHVVDLAVTLLAWTWRREAHDGEPALNAALGRALLHGYASVAPLDDAARAALYPAARFAAVRFAVTRIRDFVVGSERASDDARTYLDYREYVARLDALDAMGAGGFAALLSEETTP